ncbi:MAG: hypothetical protein M1813_004103 [Trichoglossum hirsutum]|nr:MAG: hypothetical protein M1813_004103 [Trichoglossum hirsutum]
MELLRRMRNKELRGLPLDCPLPPLFRYATLTYNKHAVIPAEGLTVDAKVGGIGFRNYTLPTGLSHGATWAEDLLFIGPETSCVNTNLTLDFKFNTNASQNLDGRLSESWLTDRGGFVGLNQTYPFYDHANAHTYPGLQARAYKAACLNNAWTMAYLNVTNPAISSYRNRSVSYLNSVHGKQFELPRSFTLNNQGLSIDYHFGNYLFPQLISSVGGRYDNPFNVTFDQFADIGN